MNTYSSFAVHFLNNNDTKTTKSINKNNPNAEYSIVDSTNNNSTESNACIINNM